jgi:hypothetical protein
MREHLFPQEGPTLALLLLSLREWITDRNPVMRSDDAWGVLAVMDAVLAEKEGE